VANNVMYFGVSHSSVGGNAYLRFLLVGLAELPSYLLLWPSLTHIGQGWTTCMALVVTSVASITPIVMLEGVTDELKLYCLSKLCVSVFFIVLPLMTARLMPYSLRKLGHSVVGKVRPIINPIVQAM
ncbi:unnamed protein product, partial [Meganyctiphanes norvegica]